jgi:predicted NBD/HSP70 family sugar kinase
MQALIKRLPIGFSQSASNKMPRQINRILIFGLVRTRQAISRAELARISGLPRSTVSLIVEELIADGWIVEGATGKLPRGRSPLFLQINDQRAVIAIDIHPERTIVAVGDLGGRIIAQNLIKLPKTPDRAIKTIIGTIKALMDSNQNKQFEGIGISLPGRTDLGLQELIFAPNLRFPARSIKAQIKRATGLSVHIDNVANACALGEVWYGHSDGLHDLVVVNVSEGIGTGIYANGQILRGSSGMAGEFGHVQIDPDGPLCACGSRGCWELAASNRAGLRYYKKISPTRGASSFEVLVKLAQSNDPEALEALKEMGRNLGRGMRMIVSSLDPHEIVVVGDITNAWQHVHSVVEEEMTRNFHAKRPMVRCAYDGGTARLRSAVALVLYHRFV